MSARLTNLVLDTNIVLDCWVFADPAVRDLTAAMETRRIRPIVHEFSLAELQRALAYPKFRLDETEQRHVLERYRALAIVAPVPEGFSRETLLLPAGFPRCRDEDDQPFLALAYHARADGLVTKDKAILRLGRGARKFGVAILAPAQCVPQVV